MPESVNLETFLSATGYIEPVPAELKKLRFIHRAVVRQAAATGRRPEDVAVLEIGCGRGGVTLPLASLGCRVRALDIDEADIAALKREASRRGYGNVEATVEDVFAFEDSRRYDIAIASEVFEHVLDPERLAEVMRRHIAPGGALIVTVPNGFGPWETKNALSPYRVLRRWNWARGLAGKTPYVRGGGRDHCQRYTRRRLVDLMSAHSFELVESGNSDFVMAVIRPLHKSAFFGNIDNRLADLVPHWMASGWYLLFKLCD